jgi:hypothetical protein
MMKTLSIVAGIFLACTSVFAQSGKPPATSTKILAHDQHGGMMISADPYVEEARAKETFGKANPLPLGILPLEVFIRNDTSQPIRVNLETVQLEFHLDSGREQIDWLTPEQVANFVAHPKGLAGPTTRRLPIPLPGRDSKTEKLVAILRPLALDADLIPPKSTVHGFLYFNLTRHMAIVPKGLLYFPDAVKVPTKEPLMFFEVHLDSAEKP